MLATAPNFAWLFFSKYLQTYLYYQMNEFETSPQIELWLYFCMIIVGAIMTPVAANMLIQTPLKAVLCIGCVCLLTGSISFIVLTNVWTFVVFQSTFTAVGSSFFQVAGLMLAWEWFSPEKRGLVTSAVVGMQAIAVSFVIGMQVVMIEYKNLAPIEEMHEKQPDIDIFP